MAKWLSRRNFLRLTAAGLGAAAGGRLEERMLTGLPALNALAPFKERTRLIVGDALKVVQQNAYKAFDGDSICMSFDPVAHDTLGLQILTALQAANNIESEATRRPAITWLQNAADLGVGTNLPDKIEFIEEKIS